MGTEDCSWNARDVLNVVDGAELVTIVRDIYLCVWYGAGTVEIYDVTDPKMMSEMKSLRFGAPRTLLLAHEAIDAYFSELEGDNLNEGLTTPLLRVIVDTESDEPTEVN
tara:strand:+ start:3230 stop:3556 length:327 start_codon:yes stop_codon:yes gene_type:complete